MLGSKLIAELGAAGNGVSESELYSYTSRLIQLRSISILIIRIMDFCLMVSSSKPLLHVSIVRSTS